MKNLKEPIINTISNLAYAGVAVALQIWLGTTIWTAIVSCGLLVLAVGSSMFHFQRGPTGETSRIGGLADEAGMFCSFLPLMYWSVYAVSGSDLVLWAGLAVGVSLLAAVLAARIDSYTLLGLVAAVTLPILFLIDFNGAAVVTTLLAAAFAVRGTGKPHGYGWLHGVWHLLTAVAVLLAAAILHTFTG